MSSFSSLPEELIERICEYLRWAKHQSDTDFRNALCNLCLTSKTCDRIARPFLYRCVELSDYDLVRFANSIINKQELAKFVISASLSLQGFEVASNLPHPIDFTQHAYEEKTYESRVVESFMGEHDSSPRVLFWTAVIECILLRLVHVQTLRLAWDLGVDVELFSQSRTNDMPNAILPSLRCIAYHGMEDRGNIRNLNKIIIESKLKSLTIIGCRSFEFPHFREPSIGKFPTVLHLNFINCPWLLPHHLQNLVTACPNLQSFRWFVKDLDEDIVDPTLTATDLVSALRPLRTKLKRLSITTDSMGDDDGFPNLQTFTALEELQVDAFELADWDEDTDSHAGSWDTVDTDIEEGLADNALSTTLPASNTAQIVLDTDSSSETDSDSTSSTDTDSPCKPILHLLPRSLETLWIDEIDLLDGGLQEQLLKLASTAHDDFPNLKKITIESEHENETLSSAFSRAGIAFVRKSVGHDWCVELGLDSYLPN